MNNKMISSDKIYPIFTYLNDNGNYIVKYKTDYSETFTKAELLGMKAALGKEFTLKTNAGIDLHSSIDCYEGIEIEKLSFFEMDLITSSICQERV